LAEYAAKLGMDIHAYILMTNNVHILTTSQGEGSISKTMQSLGRDSMCATSITAIADPEPCGKGVTDPV
jgi:REP element-mobilizing transposase RayT